MTYDFETQLFQALNGGMPIDELAKTLTAQLNSAKDRYDKEQEEAKQKSRARHATFSAGAANDLMLHAADGKITDEDVANTMRAYAILHTDMAIEDIDKVFTAEFVQAVVQVSRDSVRHIHSMSTHTDRLFDELMDILQDASDDLCDIVADRGKPAPKSKSETKKDMTPEDADRALRRFLDDLLGK